MTDVSILTHVAISADDSATFARLPVPENRSSTGRSYDFGSELITTRIQVVTNDRTAIIGRDALLPVGGIAGFTKQYCLGFLDGALAERFGVDIASKLAIYIDVHELPGLPTAALSPTVRTYVRTSDAIVSGILHHQSPLGRLMRRYNLQYLLLSGGLIAGPCFPMLRMVEPALNRVSWPSGIRKGMASV